MRRPPRPTPFPYATLFGAGCNRELPERCVNERLGVAIQGPLLGVGDDADDRAFEVAVLAVEGNVQLEPLTDGILAWPVKPSGGFVDDRYPATGPVVARVEVAATHEWSAQQIEVGAKIGRSVA